MARATPKEIEAFILQIGHRLSELSAGVLNSNAELKLALDRYKQMGVVLELTHSVEVKVYMRGDIELPKEEVPVSDATAAVTGPINTNDMFTTADLLFLKELHVEEGKK